MVVAEDTKFFHQTAVITIKASLSVEPIRASFPGPCTVHISKGILHFKVTKKSWRLLLLFPARKKEKTCRECFHFKSFFSYALMSVETCQNKNGRISLKASHNRIATFFTRALYLYLYLYRALA